MIEMINGDCIEVMANYKDNYFDLAIVDPPYFSGIDKLGYMGKGNSPLGIDRSKGFSNNQEWKVPDNNYFLDLQRVSKNQIIWGANHFSDNFKSSSSCWIVWDKDNGNSPFADIEIAYTSFNSAARIYRYRWSGMIQQDMKNKEVRIHPTQKPIALYTWLLTKYSSPAGKILDTHGGSGSSAIAAHYFGADMVWIELDKNYYTSACNRFKNETSQLQLKL